MSETPPAAALCARVFLGLDAPTPALVIEQLAGGFGRLPGAPAPRALVTAVLEREAHAPTFLGHAVALPHARLPAVTQLAVVFGRLEKAIAWTPAGDAVRLVFLAAVPATQPRPYLDFMRTLGRTLHDEAQVAALLELRDENAVRSWLTAHLALQ